MAKKILLVDDDVDFVEVNKEALEERGYQVVTAYNGEEALKKAVEESPDLVILDVIMSTPTEGIHVSHKLREHEETKNIPIIMLTAMRKRMDIKYNIEPEEEYLPVTEFVEKPIAPNKLVEKVERILERK